MAVLDVQVKNVSEETGAVFSEVLTTSVARSGDFSVISGNDIRSMLASVGVEVREGVSSETDYLLLGTPFFDEETGDMVGWESQDGHKAASALSVEVVPMRDWSQWLGL